MSTVRDLIKGSLRDITAIAAGETPSADEIADGLLALNDLIDSWSNDGFLIYEIAIESFTLTASQQEYTIGSGGDFNTTRPQIISEAGVKESGSSTEIPISVVNKQEWSGISIKSTESQIPRALFYDPEVSLGRIYLWPVPNEASTLVLYSLKPLSSFSSADDTVTLPPGYKRALRKNLAIELAPEFGKTPSNTLAESARESKTLIKRTNTKPVLLRSDADGLTDSKHTFNWITGE